MFLSKAVDFTNGKNAAEEGVLGTVSIRSWMKESVRHHAAWIITVACHRAEGVTLRG